MPNEISSGDYNTVVRAEHRFGRSKPPGPPLQPPSGGGTFDGMEPRIAKLESSVDHIQKDIGDIKTDIRTLRDNARTDFRIIFGAIIATAIGLAGLMGKGFHWF